MIRIEPARLVPFVMAGCLALATVPAPAQAPGPDPASLGPKVGESVPDFSLRDQSGRIRTLEDLMGPKGLVLVFFRSADW
jgi:hypothetical protein